MNEENLLLLSNLMDDLKRQIRTLNGNPLIPAAVKSAVETTFAILEILCEERGLDGPAA